jgi:transposase
LSKKESPINLSQEEIRAVYAQGEEAVVTLVTKLLEHLSKLESRVEDLEGRISKTSRNSSKPPSGDGFGKRLKVYAPKVKSHLGVNQTIQEAP